MGAHCAVGLVEDNFLVGDNSPVDFLVAGIADLAEVVVLADPRKRTC
jgi:hypothetical protein